jgi:hypothetical protein
LEKPPLLNQEGLGVVPWLRRGSRGDPLVQKGIRGWFSLAGRGDFAAVAAVCDRRTCRKQVSTA